MPLGPHFKKDYCNECRKETLFRYKTHNSKSIICYCSECNSKYNLTYELNVVRQFKPKQEESSLKIVIILDQLLQSKGMSQNELATKTGIRQPSINEMCRNLTNRLPLDNLARICEVLECQITDVLELVPEE